MLKFIFIIFYISLTLSVSAQIEKTLSDFTFYGDIKGLKKGKLYLSYITETGKFIEKEALINNGKFSFKGILKEPTHAFIKAEGNPDYNNDDPNFAELFIEPGRMEGHFTWNHFKQATITGSRSQNEFDSITKKQRFILLERDFLTSQSNSIKALMESDLQSTRLRKQDSILQNRINSKNQQMHQIIFSFIAGHPDSYVIPYLLFYNQPFINSDSLRQLYNSWNANIQKSYWGRKIQTIIAGLPGSVAPNFTAKDMNGDTITLAAINKNKVVLIDFWATWCVPCRTGNPHLIRLYEKYHQKGFDIISVADDDTNIAAWKKAIEHDSTGNWHQVLKGAKTENDIGIKYSVVSYPTKILLDLYGKIIFREEGSNDTALDNKLAELFDQ